MGMVYMKRANNRFEVMAVIEETLLDLISWLGESFIAFTRGQPIAIDGIEYRTDPNADLNPNGTGKVFFRNVNGQVMIAAIGTFIVKEPMLGYLILNENQLNYFFIPEIFSEPPKMTLIQPEEVDEGEDLPIPEVDIQLPSQEGSENTGEVPMETTMVEVEPVPTEEAK